MTTSASLFQQPIDVDAAAFRLREVVRQTPLQYSTSLSKRYDAHIYLKREDLQVVRSYKLRGAYNMISQLSDAEKANGLVCASAGNHAQGFAWSCRQLQVKGVIFMPVITPRQKVQQVKMHGEGSISIELVGDNFDECAKA
nr:pyridoxal-phosphate dependent enzyme [Chitinophagaceae bacterium]